MKILNIKITYILLFSVGLLILGSCKKNVVAPNSNSSGNLPPTQSNTQDSTTVGNFKINSSKINQTTDGYQFNGTLSAKTDQDTLFEIGTGDFTITVDALGKITAIDGTGIPQFPNVGIFKDMLKNFTWSKVKSHIEYQKGSYYIQKYSTDIPLNPDEYYLHFQVLDQNSGAHYELKSIVNTVIYNFTDLYIDINDPAVFFKLQLWKPGSSASAVEDVAASFWKKVSSTLISLGKQGLSYAGAPNLIVGISKQGTFKTPTYTLGLADSLIFKKLFGYDHIESMSAHFFLGLKGVPIPETVVLRLNGKVYIHEYGNEGNLKAALDWLLSQQKYSRLTNYSGSIDFGGKGIGLILTGVLPAINKVIGHDIFNNDININLVSGFLQNKTNIGLITLPSGTVDTTAFFRLGGEIHVPIIADIFGSDYQQYFPSTSPDYTGYLYLDVPNNLDSAAVFIYQNVEMTFPGTGMTPLANGYFKINNTGIRFYGETDAPFIDRQQKITGILNKDHFHFTGSVNRTISFNGVNLFANNGQITLDNVQGVTLTAGYQLPAGLETAQMSGSVASTGLSMKGTMSTGVTLGGHTFPISNSTITASTSNGVSAQFTIDLYRFSAPLKGPIYPDNTYKFTGTHTIQVPITYAGQSATLKGTIDIAAVPSGVNLTGTGNVTYTGLLGNTTTLYNGTLKVNPNWNTKTIQVCAGNYCTKL